MELFLIDAIEPFFKEYNRRRINWSKIPFRQPPTKSDAREARFAQIRRDMDSFAQQVAVIGYNAVTLDDLAHLTDHPRYKAELRQRVGVLREEFRLLFGILKQDVLAIEVTTDLMTYTPALKSRLGTPIDSNIAFLRDFPQADKRP